MALPDPIIGTPEQLVGLLGQLKSRRRYRLVEIEETRLVDPDAAASIALLESWIEQAPKDAEALQEAEADLLDFKRNMNLPRKEAGARLPYPEVE